MIHLGPGNSAFWLSAGCTMVHVVWIGAIIGLFAWAGRLILSHRGVAIRYRFTLVCLGTLALVPAAIYPCIEMQIQSPQVVASTGSGLLGVGSAGSTADAADDDAWWAAELAAARESSINLASGGDSIVRSEVMTSWLTWVSIRGPWLWVCGTGVMLLITAGGLCAVMRMRRSARREDGPIQARSDMLCASIGVRSTPIALLEGLCSPVLIGWLRPMILLPSAAESQWTTEQLDMVLIHELAHAKRRDNLVTLVQRVMEVLFFYNPAVWYLSRSIRRDREELCDRFVLTRTSCRRAYAELLLGFADTPIGCRLGTAMGEHDLVSRIRSVLEPDRPSRISRRAVASAGLILLLAFCSIGAYRAIAAIPLPRAAALSTMRGSLPQMKPVAEQIAPQPMGAVSVPAAAISSPVTARTVSSATAAEPMMFMVVDGYGWPVAGVWCDANVRFRNDEPIWEEKTSTLSNDNGLILSPVVPVKGFTQFYFHQAEQRLVGTALVKKSTTVNQATVVLHIPCRVAFNLIISGADKPLNWTKAFIRMVDDSCPDNLLRQTRTSEPWHYEFDLPPGRYELIAFGGDNDEKRPRTNIGVYCFDVVAGQRELDLGKIAVPIKPAAPNKLKTTEAAAGFVGIR